MKSKIAVVRWCFDDTIIFEDFDFDSILSDEKSFQNFSIYDILYKTLSGVRPLRIKFEKVDRFIRNYDGTRYLV